MIRHGIAHRTRKIPQTFRSNGSLGFQSLQMRKAGISKGRRAMMYTQMCPNGSLFLGLPIESSNTIAKIRIAQNTNTTIRGRARPVRTPGLENRSLSG
jgi:hypothetical protein